jgi:DNA polymerase-3 subunit delta
VARKAQEHSTPIETVTGWLKEGTFSPLYLFYGEEDFLIDELVGLLTDRAIDPSMRGFNQDVVSARDLDARAIAAMASAYPMMGDRRLVVVRNIDALNAKELTALLPSVEQPLVSTILACTAQKPDFRTRFYKAFQANGVTVECKPLYDNQVAGWIGARIRALGKKASPEACQVMQGYVSSSLREIQNEIDKLFTYVGEKREITADDVTQVVGMSKLWNIFELQKAVGQRDIARSLEISQRLLQAGESPIYEIVMLTKYFQKLAILPELASRHRNEYELASAVGVNKFFLPEYAAAARRYGPADLERCFAALLDADLRMKSSSPDPAALMTELLYAFMAPERRTEAV